MTATGKKRIVLLSCNDLLGGAAIVTYRLMRALHDLGHDADMLVTNKLGDDPHVHQLGTAATRKWQFLAERLGIFMRNGLNRRDLFKVSTASTGMNIHNHPLVRQADAIFVNWVNQGTMSLNEMHRLCAMGKPVVWTMHDMWNMTGICHHAYGCSGFHDSCGNCKYLGHRASATDLSHTVWLRKKALYDSSEIRFVAVSNWVKQCASRSSLLRDKEVTVIHNAFPAEQFPVGSGGASLATDDDKGPRHVIAFGAAKLDDPVKGIRYAIDALNILADQSPQLADKSIAIFFGRLDNTALMSDLRFPHKAIGSITDKAALQKLMGQTDVILSTSLYETLGGTLIEGMSAGATPVSFGEGGQVDIIDHKSTGYIARYLDPADVAEGIRWALATRLDRNRQHKVVSDRFNARDIALKYLSLIS